MSRTHPWTDGYLWAVALQVRGNFFPQWRRFVEVDATLSRDVLEHAIARISAAGVALNEDGPPDIVVPESCAADFGVLWNEVKRIRAAGALIFDPIAEMPDYIVCTTAFPREYLSLPPFSEVSPDEIEILNFGDMPPEHPQWIDRRRIERCPNLKVLFLYGNRFDKQPVGVDLKNLRSLKALNVRDNGLTAIPTSVLGCSRLESLYLAGNPIQSVAGVETISTLRYLELYRSGVSDEQAYALKLKLPGCSIVTSSGGRI